MDKKLKNTNKNKLTNLINKKIKYLIIILIILILHHRMDKQAT
ncbi:hypothetical protein J3E06_000775 [Methanococcus voltae]|uniref:Uncharacterized protein n=1 Tax=Methanococcus voltae (strain ATCC BAA-1334 / A3) TaxID=456320 RepID=D7DRF4_METV3|nr:hypothetical protein [Methanococcus voltae]